MCNACGNLCCGSDQFDGCGCEHCFDPACMPTVCKSCADPRCPATDGIEQCIKDDLADDNAPDYLDLGL